MTINRLSLLKSLLDAKKCTHILVSDSSDVLSVTGFKSSNVFLLVSHRSSFLFTDFRYATAAEAFCKRNAAWQFRQIKQSSFDFLKRYVPAGSRIGIQSECLSVDAFGKLRSKLEGVSFVKLSGAVPGLSVVKTAQEIAVMRRCAQIADQGLRRTLKRLGTGMSERDVAFFLDNQCRLIGADAMGFDTIVLFGVRSALPHGVPGDTQLRVGDWVLFDFGCELEGLRSDMTRTIVFGRASARQRRIYELVLRAQSGCRNAIKAGMKAADADALARRVIDRAGYRDNFGHGTGHGVGYRIHEAPRIGRLSKDVLLDGSVVTVEPGVYIKGFGGVRIEDMVRLHAGGAEPLTAFPRELIEVTP